MAVLQYNVRVILYSVFGVEQMTLNCARQLFETHHNLISRSMCVCVLCSCKCVRVFVLGIQVRTARRVRVCFLLSLSLKITQV